MEQILVDAYAIANIGLLIYYIRNYGWSISPGLLVLLFYVAIAIFAIPAYETLQSDEFFSNYDFTNITLFPYVFLFITTLFFLLPTFKFQQYTHNVKISISHKKTYFFIIIYSICSLISIYCFYRTASSNVSIEVLNQLRQDLYEGETLKPYSNIIEHICIYITVNLNIIATIIFFYSLTNTQNKINYIWLILLGCGIVIPPFVNAMITASRGMIITQVFQLLICYSYFSKKYSKKVKRIFGLAGIMVMCVFLVYSLIVTSMRFGMESDDAAISSLISYFGQPTIVFNSQTADINHFANGALFFYPLVDALGINPDMIITPIVKKWTLCFYTLTGYLYVDFGPIGTFLLSIFIPYAINTFFFHKKKLTIAHLYLMTFYCLTLQHGALVLGRGFIINIITCFIIYQITKLMFNSNKRKHLI